jgi:hypothetical protein
VWDAEGRYLAFTRHDLASNTSRLLLFDAQANTLFPLADGLITGFPPAFTRDNSGLLYISKTGSPPEIADELSDTQLQPSPEITGEIYRIQLQPAAIPELVGEFPYAIGCAGGITNSLSWAYAQETETTPGWGHLILAETPYGILHSESCSGRRTALLDPVTGEDRSLLTNLLRLFLSPDRSQAIAIQNDDDTPMVLIDLASGETAPLPVNQTIFDMVWYDNDTVFYSAQRGTEAEWGIWKLELTAQRSGILYRARDTRLLARLTATADGSGLYFSQIVEPADTQHDTPITVNLLRLDLQTGAAETIGSDIHKATIHPSAP